jgi:hypothetical protein
MESIVPQTTAMRRALSIVFITLFKCFIGSLEASKKEGARGNDVSWSKGRKKVMVDLVGEL